MILVDAVKLWWKARKVKLSTWLFNRLYKDKDSGMARLIENGVNQRATHAIVAWLEFKHIMHCEFCIQTEQLRNVAGKYRCEAHTAGLKLETV